MGEVRKMVRGPMALKIEAVPATEARPPLEDEFIYLMGRPPLASFIRFVRNEAVDGQALNPRSLREEWLSANDHIRELEETEAGWADNPEIRPLPPDLEPLRDELLKDPIFQQAFDTLPTEIGVVELDRLVVFQKHINLTYVRQLQERLGPSPREEEIFRAALPSDHSQPPAKWMKVHGNSYVFFSPSNDLRFLGPMVLQSSHIQGVPPPGSVVGVVGLAVGFGSNFLNVISAENRLVLNNGSHRAFALRDLGVTHAPAVIQSVSSREELKLVGSSDLRRHPDLYLQQPRPSTLKDYFEPKLRKAVFVARQLRQVRVKFEIDEAYVPAMWPA